MPKVGMQDLRRQQLIDAAMQVIRDRGLEETTVSSVAQTAGLSSGIVAHYFGNKSGLLEATMRQILRDLQASAARRRAAAEETPRAQIRAIIDANFDATQTDPDVARVWLAFWAASMNQPELRRLQRINDRRLRSNLVWQFGRRLPRAQARDAGAGLAALIDGLWLRGSLSDPCFDVGLARRLACDYADLRLAAG